MSIDARETSTARGGTGESQLWERLQSAPDDPRAFRQLASRLLESEDTDQLVRLYRSRAEAVGPPESILLHLAIAEHVGQGRPDRERIEAAYRDALGELARDEGALGVRDKGFTRLRENIRETCWQRGFWSVLGQLMAEDAERADSGDERGSALLELARFRVVKLGQTTEAAFAYLQATRESADLASVCLQELRDLHANHPDNLALADALEEVYRDSGRYDALYQLLLRRHAAIDREQVAPRFNSLIALARLAGRDLGRWEQAAEHLRDAAQLQPERAAETVRTAEDLRRLAPEETALLRFVEATARELGDWQRALAVVEARLALVDGGRERADLHLSRADLLWTRLGRQRDALAAYDAALIDAPELSEAITERYRGYLDALADDQPDGEARRQLEHRLEALLRSSADTASLLSLWEDRLRRQSDPGERLELLFEMGDLYRTELKQAAKAFDYYERVSEAAVAKGRTDALLERLFPLAEAGVRFEEVGGLIERVVRPAERWDDLLHLLTLRLQRAGDPRASADVHFEMAELLAGPLSQRETALKHYRRAAENAPDNLHYIRVAREVSMRAGHQEAGLELLDRELALAESPEQQARLVCQKADFLVDELNDPRGAMRHLFQWLPLDDGAGTIADRLQRALQSEDGLQTFESLLDEARGDAASSSDLAQLGTAAAVLLLETAPESAAAPQGNGLDVLLAVDRRSALGASHQAALEAGLAAQERYPDLADVMQRRVERSTDQAERRDALRELVALCGRHLDDADRAVAAYWHLVRTGPLDWETAKAFETLLREHERHSELERLYELVSDQVDWSAPPEDFRALLERRAALQLEQLDRLDLAADSYRQLLRLDPFCEEALAFFEQHYSQAEDALSYFQVLADTVDTIDDPDRRAARLAEVGEVARSRLSDPTVAAEYWERVLDDVDANPAATASAVAGLKRVYEESEQHEQLLRVLRVEVSLCDDAARRAELMVQMVDLLETLGRLREMLSAIDDLLLLRPGDVALLERACDTALQLDDARAEAHYARRLAEAADDRPDFRMRLARVLADELGEREAALEELRVVLDQSPADDVALDAVEELLSTDGRFKDLLEILRQQVERAPSDDSRFGVLSRVVEVAPLEAQQDEDARAWALAQMRELRPDDLEVVKRLMRHHEDRRQWDQAVELAEDLIERVTDEAEQAELLRRLGAITEHELSQPEAALAIYRRLTQLLPRDAGSRRALLRLCEKTHETKAIPAIVAELLELSEPSEELLKLVQRASSLAERELEDSQLATQLLLRYTELDPLETGLLKRLGRLLETAERWEELADVLNRLAGLSATNQERIEAWSKRALILEEKLNRLEEAAGCYRDILHLHSANRLALNAQKRIFAALGRWRDVLSVLARLAQLDADPNVRAATLRECAEVYEKHLDDPVRALELHRQAHEMLGDETASLEEMRRLAEAHGLFRPYLAVLVRDMERVHDPVELQERLFDCARIMDRQLDEPQAAFDLLHGRFDPAPRDDELFAELTDLTLRREMWDELEAIHRRLVRVTLEPKEKVQFFFRLADLLAEKAGAPERALAILREAHLAYPAGGQALERMEGFAAAHDLWAELDQFYEERWREASGAREKVRLLRQRAELLETKLERWEEAFGQIVIAFQLAPDDRELEEELFRFASQYDKWETVIKLLDVLAKERPERALRVHLLQRVAETVLSELADSSRAFDYIARAWRIDPANEALREELLALALQAGRLEHVADAYEWEANHRIDLTDRVDAWLRLAGLCKGEVADLERAIHAYTQAYQLAPRRTETIEALRETLLERDLGERLLAVLTEWLEHAPSPEDRSRLFRSLAEVATQLGRVDEAVEAYRGVLGINPKDVDALDGLARLHRSVGDWDRVIRCLQQSLRVVEAPERRHEIMDELAELYTRLQKYELAISVLEESAHAFPDRELPTERIVDLYLRLNRPEEALTYLESVGVRTTRPDAASALLMAAKIAARDLNDPTRAVRLCTRVTRMDPKNREAWMVLAVLSEATERWRDQVDALSTLAELAGDDTVASIEEWAPLVVSLLDPESPVKREDFESLPAPRAAAVYLGLAARTNEDRLYYPGRAADLWRQAAEADPDWALPPLHLARLAGTSKPDDTVEACRLAVSRLESRAAPRLVSHAWYLLAHALEEVELEAEDLTESVEGVEPVRAELPPEEARLAPEGEPVGEAAGEAALLRLLGDPISAYEAALRAFPRHEPARVCYLAMLEERDELARAEPFFRELLTRTADDADRRPALLGLARTLEGLGQKAAALEVLEEASQTAGNDPDVARSLADLALDRGEFERAVVLYQSLLERAQAEAPEEGETPAQLARRFGLHMQLGKAAERGGMDELAQEQFGIAHALQPENLAAKLGLGRMALRRGALALARHYVDEVLEVTGAGHSMRAAALSVRADLLAARGDLDGMVTTLEHLRIEQPRVSADVLRRLADGYLEQGRWELALATLEQLERQLSPGPERAELLVELATLYRQRADRPEKAWEALVAATQMAPENVEIKEIALAAAVDMGRWEPAELQAQWLLQRLTDSRRVSKVRLKAGAAALGAGDLKSARSHFSAAARLDPHNAEAIQGLIRTATRQKDWMRLRHELTAHLDRVDSSRPDIRGLILKSLAEILAGPLEDLGGALKVYDELGHLHPSDPDIQRMQVQLHRSRTPADGEAVADALAKLVLLGDLDLDSIGYLQQWYRKVGNTDGDYLMTALLSLCGATSADEQQALRRAVRSASEITTDPSTWEGLFERQLRTVRAPQELVAQLRHAARSAAGGFADGLAADTGAPEPLAIAFTRVGGALGVMHARLDLRPGLPVPILVNEPTPRVVADPALFEGLNQAEIRFQLGRLATLCRPELIMCAVLDDFEYLAFHEAAVEPLLQPDEFDRDEGLEMAVRRWRQVLGRDPMVDPRQGRPAGEGLDRARLPGPAEWRQSAEETAIRVGLLYADHLEAALDQLVRGDRALEGRRVNSVEALRGALQVSPQIRQLLAFYLKPSHLDVRRRLGASRTDFAVADEREGTTEPSSLDDKLIAEFEMEIEEDLLDDD